MLWTPKRTTTLWWCAAALAGLLLLPSMTFAGNDACPDGGTKLDIEGPAGFSCGEGEVLTGICAKAGRGGFGVGDGDPGSGAGCYEYSGIGDSAGSVGGGGTGRDCKTISHSVFYCGPGEPPNDPVCGDGVLEGDEQCEPPGRIDELFVCNEACQIIEVPLPDPDPVCGNGEVEAGEACDPPGRIDPLFVCTEGCQIMEDPSGGEEPGGI